MNDSHLSTRNEATMMLLGDWQARVPKERGASLLDTIKSDAQTFDFLRQTFEVLTLPRDTFSRAVGMKDLLRHMPEVVPASVKLGMQVGSVASLALPWGVIPALKNIFRARLSEIVETVSLPTEKNSPSVRALLKRLELPEAGVEFEVWGAPAFGGGSASENIARIGALMRTIATEGKGGKLGRVAVDISRVLPLRDAWSHDAIVSDPPAVLRELFLHAKVNGVRLTLLASNYADAMLLPRLVLALLSDSELQGVDAVVTLYAEFPESFEQAKYILENAAEPVTVRVTTRSLSAVERINSFDSGLAVPSFDTREATSAQALRVLGALLDPQPKKAHRVVLETDSVLLHAAARVLAQTNGTDDRFEAQRRYGVVPELDPVLTEVTLGVPIVRSSEFPEILANVLNVFADALDDTGPKSEFERVFADPNKQVITDDKVRDEVRALNTAANAAAPASHRMQSRRREWDPDAQNTAIFYKPPTEMHDFDTGGLTTAVLKLAGDGSGTKLSQADRPQRIPVVSGSGFSNEPDTDATSAENRAWMRSVMALAERHGRELGDPLPNREKIKPADPARVGHIVNAGAPWRLLSERERASVMRRVALSFASARDLFVTSLAADRALSAQQIDLEISTAIDATRYLALRAEGLRAVRGAVFESDEVVLLVAGTGTTFGSFTESLMATLAAGSPALCFVNEAFAETVRILSAELEAGGLPAGTVQIITVPGEDMSIALERVVLDPRIKRGIFFTDDRVTDRVRRIRPDLIRDQRLGGIGTAIVSHFAEKSSAVNNLTRSSFTLAGANPFRVNALILVDSVTKKADFLDALKDAAETLSVVDLRSGDKDLLAAQIAPLETVPVGDQRRALTELQPGEKWLLAPRQLDDLGRAWSPGIKTGVSPDSWFWKASVGLPVLGVTSASDFAHAIKLQEQIGSGTVSALFSLDDEEVSTWLDHSSAAGLIVNKASDRGRVERLPSGVWNSGNTALQPLSGSPTRLLSLGTWHLREGSKSDTLHLRGLVAGVTAIIETSQSLLDYEAYDRVRRAALADALAWRTQFGIPNDVTRMPTELNVLRYLPVDVQVRASEDASFEQLVRVLIAGVQAGANFSVSSARNIPRKLRAVLEMQGIPVFLESDDDWLKRLATVGDAAAGAGERPFARVRMIGGNQARVSEWISQHGQIALVAQPVTMAGSVELFGFVREQALSVAATRHGYVADIEQVRERLG